jgi:hypothetical protein
MKETPKGNRLLVYDSAKLDCPLEDSTRPFCNVLVDRESATIAHMWISLRRPDVSELSHELRWLRRVDAATSIGRTQVPQRTEACTDGRRARNCRQKTFHVRGGLKWQC